MAADVAAFIEIFPLKSGRLRSFVTVQGRAAQGSYLWEGSVMSARSLLGQRRFHAECPH